MGRAFEEPYRKDPNCLRVQRKIEATSHLLNQIPVEEVHTAKDYFGGLGYQANLVVQRFRGVKFLVQDLFEECVENLRAQFRGNRLVSVRQQDFFTDNDSKTYDLVMLDWNTFTLTQFKRNERLRKAAEGILSRGHRYLLTTDVARQKFHLNAKSYGVETFDEYVKKSAREIFKGYSLADYVDKTEVAYLLLRLR